MMTDAPEAGRLTWTRATRIASLIGAPMLATCAAVYADDDRFLRIATPVLVALCLVMIAAVVGRLFVESTRPIEPGRRWPWDHLDVLTASGATLLWTGALALCLAAATGWASASWIGALGLATVYLVATWTAIVAGGPRPWRAAQVTRTIVPEIALEGDALREDVVIRGAWLPPGMRMFATGRTTRHGAVTRYAINDAGGELRLASELGGAIRGEHDAPAMALWLGDTLGLTRTPVVYRGAARFTVLPRPGDVPDARALLGAGGDDAQSRPAQQPTEGTFRIREYVPGDDPRRIHWVRSQNAGRLIMRLPDEVPPEAPEVRLVLDTELGSSGALGAIEDLSCRAPAQLLDAMVHIWLGIARSLAAAGTRVTLVAAVRHGGAVEIVERRMQPGAPREALRLGARVAWQNELPLAALLAHSRDRQVVVSARPCRLSDELIAPLWVIVPEAAWTSPEAWTPTATTPFLPFPIGAEDNRPGRIRRERQRVLRMKQDRAVFSQVVCWSHWEQFPGNYVARPDHDRVALAVIE